MDKSSDYLTINKTAWNQRTIHHVASAFYDVPGFLAGKTSLNEIELKLLGDVHGKKILHLQCHFGQDSISLSRMGATVTGVDFSENAIAEAESLASKAGADTHFICSDIYSLTNKLTDKFDIVFTSYGTISWLPDLDAWAQIISGYLVPGGKFIFAEFHPVVWMFDNDFNAIVHPYAKSDAIVETEHGTYAEKDAPINLEMVTWNHSIAEVLQSLLKHSLRIESFEEFDYSPYNCFSGMLEFEPGKFRVEKLGNKIPMVYALSAVK